MLVHTQFQRTNRNLIDLVHQQIAGLEGAHLHRIFHRSDTGIVQGNARGVNMQLQITRAGALEGMHKLLASAPTFINGGKVPTADVGAYAQIIQMLTITDEHIGILR